MEANGVSWGQTAAESVVFIEALGGWQEILKPGVIETELKSSGLEVLGVLVDADDSLEAKWHALRARCIQSFPEMPDELPPGGVVVENMSKKRFGAWVLPDNRSRGMMETFLSFLVPSEQDSLWQYAIAATNQARDHGAKYRDAHGDKACIHTWLAWSDPPGRQLHQAVIERILDPNSQHAQGFVRWFRALYEI